jgi:hypothetical protein
MPRDVTCCHVAISLKVKVFTWAPQSVYKVEIFSLGSPSIKLWKQLVEHGTNTDVLVGGTSQINEGSCFVVCQSHLHSVVKFGCIDLKSR